MRSPRSASVTKIKHTLHCILGSESTTFEEYRKLYLNKNDQQREMLLNYAVYSKVFSLGNRSENNFVKECHKNNYVRIQLSSEASSETRIKSSQHSP